MNTMMQIVVEAFQARLLPLFDETTLAAMKAFNLNGYTQYLPAAAAGALLASAIIYALGVWLRRLPSVVSTPEQQTRIEKLRQAAHEWLPWLLILSPTPVGGILILAAGFFALRPLTAGLAIVGAEILWRVAPILSQ